ncbi:hypothetical protein E2562_038557 [Oryza meyeriana var. granulata]|uniref:Uncharacterized protein n=1 Tax=Oryza meyeriana var. granulata TaxID=110450 RepID=A0A6G1F266_9ORYZ|nr:hypothetical protein E2562_038557 [Oryza meyeriana var. granulata]
MKKGKWSKEEDDLIKNHMEKYGIGRSWQAVSDALGLQRCGRSCRSRWLNYLRPGLKHGDFTPAEERFICKMYSKRGSSWSTIAAQLPGRTDLAVKNYWNSTLKKSEGSTAAAAAGSSSHAGEVDELAPYSGPSPAQTQQPEPAAIADAAEQEEPIAAAPVSTVTAGGILPPEKTPPPPPVDRTGEVNIPCFPFSPLPFVEPDLPELAWTTDLDDIAAFDDDACCYPKRPLPIPPDSPRLQKLPSIAGFDDMQSFWSWLDD